MLQSSAVQKNTRIPRFLWDRICSFHIAELYSIQALSQQLLHPWLNRLATVLLSSGMLLKCVIIFPLYNWQVVLSNLAFHIWQQMAALENEIRHLTVSCRNDTRIYTNL
jgi:hypothetical protein